MIIGVPRETHRDEHRVGLSPSAAALLARHGHQVLVERGAGLGARFADRDYQQAGAQIVYRSDEAYLRSDLVCRVGALSGAELDLLQPGATICAFHHLAVAPRASLERLAGLETTLIGYELVRDRAGRLAILPPISELAGPMAVQVAAHYLQNESGGRGILLGNVPGVPPPTVLVLGAGTVGRTAARQALDAGAHVIVVDSEIAKLTEVNRLLAGRAVTAIAGLERLEQYTAFADVVIGAVLIPGGRAPFLVTEGMVRAMKPGSVVLDLSIDQGGCVETSRPTTLADPVFVAHDVIHYCVPNMTANVARTASRALTNAALPFVLELADRGIRGALAADHGLAAGVCLYRGHVVHERIAGAQRMAAESLTDLLAAESS